MENVFSSEQSAAMASAIAATAAIFLQQQQRSVEEGSSNIPPLTLPIQSPPESSGSSVQSDHDDSTAKNLNTALITPTVSPRVPATLTTAVDVLTGADANHSTTVSAVTCNANIAPNPPLSQEKGEEIYSKGTKRTIIVPDTAPFKTQSIASPTSVASHNACANNGLISAAASGKQEDSRTNKKVLTMHYHNHAPRTASPQESNEVTLPPSSTCTPSIATTRNDEKRETMVTSPVPRETATAVPILISPHPKPDMMVTNQDNQKLNVSNQTITAPTATTRPGPETTPTTSSSSSTTTTGPLRLNKFVRRLHDMLKTERDTGIVEWRRGLLVLHSTDAFTKLLLPKYFHTKNFKTFRRQLNYYGFVHVRSFSTTGSATTALWVNRSLAQQTTSSDISSVLLLKRVEPQQNLTVCCNDKGDYTTTTPAGSTNSSCGSNGDIAGGATNNPNVITINTKTAEGRRIRKELAVSIVEDDIGISTKSLQLQQIRSIMSSGSSSAPAAGSTTTSADNMERQEQSLPTTTTRALSTPMLSSPSYIAVSPPSSVTTEQNYCSLPIPVTAEQKNVNHGYASENHSLPTAQQSTSNTVVSSCDDDEGDAAANLLLMLSTTKQG